MIFRIVTLGCKLNFAESSALSKVLLEHGHTKAKAGEEVDVIIVNTCSVTDTADQKDRQAIHRLKRENPNARIIVTGCYAALQPQQIASMPEVSHVIPKDLNTFHPAYSKDDRTRCFLKIQDGCNYFCTYCTIPLARGRSRNGSIASIVAQAKEALVQGAKEIVLTGVNIGDFGRSTNERFIDLLIQLDNIETLLPYSSTPLPPYRIRISSCEPNLLTDEIIEFVAHSKHFAPHFHIPLQSGSDEMLKIMHRHYDTALFTERINHIRQVMPHAFIGVDCMVGVRGETQERWDEYVNYISSLPVSQLHVFTYSERANTRMLTMDLPIIPMAERHRRSEVLHRISEQKLKTFYEAHKGLQATVLWEGKRVNPTPLPPYPSTPIMYGFTENYIKVSRPYDKTKVNTFETITL